MVSISKLCDDYTLLGDLSCNVLEPDKEPKLGRHLLNFLWYLQHEMFDRQANQGYKGEWVTNWCNFNVQKEQVPVRGCI